MQPERTMKRTFLSTAILGFCARPCGACRPGDRGRRKGPLPASPACTDSGATVDRELWAKTGTVSLPNGGWVAVWGCATYVRRQPDAARPRADR